MMALFYREENPGQIMVLLAVAGKKKAYLSCSSSDWTTGYESIPDDLYWELGNIAASK